MIKSTTKLPDLRIYTCIPNCRECPGTWINKLIKHQIVCICCKSGHQIKIKVESDDYFGREVAEDMLVPLSEVNQNGR